MEMTTAAAAFNCAEIQEGERGPKQCYEIVIIGLSNKPFVATSGIVFKPHKSFKNAPPLDTLVIPGGRRLTLLKTQIGKPIAAFVKARAGCTRRIVSVCSGIYGLAMTGLLAGRKVATHWRYAQDVARRFPEVQVDDNAIFLKDGPFYTSAGARNSIPSRCNSKRSQFRVCLSWRHGRLVICMRICQWRLWQLKHAFVPGTLVGGSR